MIENIELDLTIDEKQYGTNIKLIGVGGAGGNAVNAMINNKLEGVEYIVANTNINDLRHSKTKLRIQLGKKLTGGQGAGANPEIGEKAATESLDDIKSYIENANMLFIAAGMGGGTGTGASPIIAKLAKEMDILTVGIVNTPFNSEGTKRAKNAEDGIKLLKENVDTLIVVPNEKLRENTNNMTFLGAFEKANNILYKATKAIADIIHTTGHINVDFADIKTIIQNRGLAMIGTGSGDGDDRAKNAVNKAINNPLLEDISIQNAEGVLVNITAGKDFKMDEYDEITKLVVEKSGNAGDIIHGIVIDEKLEGKIKVTLIATGLEDPSNNKKRAIDINDITTQFSNFEENQNNSDDEMSRTLDIIRKNENPQLSPNLNRTLGNSDEQQLEVPAFLRSNNN